VYVNSSSSFEPDVVCSVSIISLPTVLFNSEAVLFACLSSCWTTTMSIDCLAPNEKQHFIDGLHNHFNRCRLSIETFFIQSKVIKMLSKWKKRKGLAGKCLDIKPAPIEVIM